MASDATSDEVLRRVVAALDSAGVPYMITGSLASSLHGASREFSRREFERRIEVSALGTSLYVARPEDVLLAKLEWAKRSGSERQIEDAAAIIRTQGDRLENAYVESWLERLDIREQWDAALARSMGGGPTSPAGDRPN